MGGKGANLAEMTNLGLPVPPGFTISTEACRAYLDGRDMPRARREVDEQLTRLEEKMGKRLGDPEDPLLVSVRSGAKFSMPGMMETVLNVGLNDRSRAGAGGHWVATSGSPTTLPGCCRCSARTVLGIEARASHETLDGLKADRGVKNDVELAVADLQGPGHVLPGPDPRARGSRLPQEPREQLDMAVRAVFDSWNTDRAALYRGRSGSRRTGHGGQRLLDGVRQRRRRHRTGVAFTRDPASGRAGHLRRLPLERAG